MANKRLRIMILERDHQLRRSVEKMLNALGYYRVAIMGNASEVFSVLSHAMEAFDLVIANRALVAGARVDFNVLCEGHPMVRHLLIYDCHDPVFTGDLMGAEGTRHTSFSHPPDMQSMGCLMRLVEEQALQPPRALKLDTRATSAQSVDGEFHL